MKFSLFILLILAFNIGANANSDIKFNEKIPIRYDFSFSNEASGFCITPQWDVGYDCYYLPTYHFPQNIDEEFVRSVYKVKSSKFDNCISYDDFTRSIECFGISTATTDLPKGIKALVDFDISYDLGCSFVLNPITYNRDIKCWGSNTKHFEEGINELNLLPKHLKQKIKVSDNMICVLGTGFRCVIKTYGTYIYPYVAYNFDLNDFGDHLCYTDHITRGLNCINFDSGIKTFTLKSNRHPSQRVKRYAVKDDFICALFDDMSLNCKNLSKKNDSVASYMIEEHKIGVRRVLINDDGITIVKWDSDSTSDMFITYTNGDKLPKVIKSDI
jgi:hypothetical protein